MRKETKVQSIQINKRARHAIKNLALFVRAENRVLAIQGLDAFTICVCDDPVDAEVIKLVLNEKRRK